MPVFKNESNGTWYVMARYVNWKGERKQKCKRGFTTKKEAQEWERMQDKTVQIVSDNNSATENVYDKLSSPKYDLGFVAATLGSSKNKKTFVEHQDSSYPDFLTWKMSEEFGEMRKKISEQSVRLKEFFDKKEKLAYLRQELSQLVTEQQYFNQYVEESDVNTDNLTIRLQNFFLQKSMVEEE